MLRLQVCVHEFITAKHKLKSFLAFWEIIKFCLIIFTNDKQRGSGDKINDSSKVGERSPLGATACDITLPSLYEDSEAL